MNNLQVFESEQFGRVRTVMVDNEPWFVAQDVCRALDVDDTATRRLDDDEKGLRSIHTLGGNQEMSVVSESGLYSLVLGSRKPEAKLFKRWITHEVIPAIRKTGGYLGNTADMSDMEIMAKAFLISKRTIEEKDKLITKLSDANTKLLPKAEFFDAVAESKSAIEMASVAKVLDMGIGRNNLFESLRQKKILMGNNQPYQKFVDMGLFRVIEQKFNKPNGDTCINIKTLVYQKGIDYIRKLLSERGN